MINCLIIIEDRYINFSLKIILYFYSNLFPLFYDLF